MSLSNFNSLHQTLLLAGTLSLTGGAALAQTAPATSSSASTAGSASARAAGSASASTSASAERAEGRAGIATLCIEKRSYVDVNQKKIVTPNIYIDAMPPEGIDTGYVEGNAVAKKWEEFLKPTDPEKKKWLEDTDIPDQANAAIDLVKQIDKDKNGIITPMEFEEGTRGKSLEDKKTDLAFLTSLRCDNQFFTEGALDAVPVDAFPEVIALKGDLGKTKAHLQTARADFDNLKINHDAALNDLAAARVESQKYRTTTMGLGALGILLGVGLVVALVRKKGAKAPTPPAPGKPAPAASPRIAGVGVRTEVVISDNRTKGNAEEETRIVTDTAAGASPQPQPATRTVTRVEADMADLEAALRKASENKSPAPGISPSNPPAVTSITADNVIIRGTDAKPSAELNKNVVMAEIAYLNPKFLTEDGAAIHPNFRSGVEQLADLAMHAFGKQDTNAASPTELWRVEHGKHGSMIRGGLPEQWLREFVSGQLEKWHAAGAPGMSFDVTTRETMERDAARRAGERSAYEKWVENALRGL